MAKQGKSKKTSDHQKALYKMYKDSGQRTINKRLKLKRHMKAHPEDTQAKKALDKL